MEGNLWLWMVAHRDEILSGNVTDELIDEYNKIAMEDRKNRTIEIMKPKIKLNDWQMRQISIYGYSGMKRKCVDFAITETPIV